MTVPQGPPPVTYRSGTWIALAYGDVVLLAEPVTASTAPPVIAACWAAVVNGAGFDGVLAAIVSAGATEIPSFALVGSSADGGTRLVVSGRAQVEVQGPAGVQPSILSGGEAPTSTEQRLPGRPGVRLVAGSQEGPDQGGPFPIAAAVVLASVVGVGVTAESRTVSGEPQVGPGHAPAPPAPAPSDVVAPDDALAHARPVSNDTMPPHSQFDSGLIDSLPWRSPAAYSENEGQPAVQPGSQPAVEPDPPTAAQPSWGNADQAPNPQNPWAPAQPAWSEQPEQQPWQPPATQTPTPAWPEPPAQQSWQPPTPPAPQTAAWPDAGPAQPAWPQPAATYPAPGSAAPGSAAPNAAAPNAAAPKPAEQGVAAQNPWAPPVPGATPSPVEGPCEEALPVRPDLVSAPVVHAFLCPRQHLNPPYAGSCRICNDPIPPQEGVAAPRPSLGVLTLSTGDMVPLDRDIVLGRAPFHPDEDAASRPHLVQLASPGNDISRSHVRVNLENWFVQVTDLGSTNGTVVTLPDQAPVRLRPHDPYTILPGTTVNIADEVTLRYEVPS